MPVLHVPAGSSADGRVRTPSGALVPADIDPFHRALHRSPRPVCRRHDPDAPACGGWRRSAARPSAPATSGWARPTSRQPPRRPTTTTASPRRRSSWSPGTPSFVFLDSTARTGSPDRDRPGRLHLRPAVRTAPGGEPGPRTPRPWSSSPGPPRRRSSSTWTARLVGGPVPLNRSPRRWSRHADDTVTPRSRRSGRVTRRHRCGTATEDPHERPVHLVSLVDGVVVVVVPTLATFRTVSSGPTSRIRWASGESPVGPPLRMTVTAGCAVADIFALAPHGRRPGRSGPGRSATLRPGPAGVPPPWGRRLKRP